MPDVPTINAIEDLWLKLDRAAEERYNKESAEWTYRTPWPDLSEDTKSVWRGSVIRAGFQLKLEI